MSKELIKQYANTGAKLPKYQVKKLSKQPLKSYLRNRLIISKTRKAPLKEYEVVYSFV